MGDQLKGVFPDGDLGVRWYDAEHDLLHFFYEYEKGVRLNLEPLRPTSKAWKIMVETLQPILIRNAEDYRKYEVITIPGTEPGKSAMMVPIAAGQQIIGSIVLESFEQEDAYSDSDVRLLQTVASSMGVALQNARLFEETSRHARESAALNDVGRDISSTLDLPTVMDRIASNARELLKVDTSAIFLREADGSSYKAIVVQGVDAEEIKADTITTGEGIIGMLANEGKAEFINDTKKDPRGVQIPGTPEEEQERLMVAPLLAGEKVSGMMAVWREGGDPFAHADLEFLQGLSLQAAIAIKNANLFDEIEQRAAELAIINSVQDALAAQLDLQKLYELIGEKVRTIFDAQISTIVTYDLTGSMLHHQYYAKQGQRLQIDPVPLTDIAWHLIRTKQPLLINADW
ncbi:MAG TPA: GAF domain-containing protein, partial [Anaerolineales bacterium]|nr:GAF domain-containing protein [Anaerolineales bacterium]